MSWIVRPLIYRSIGTRLFVQSSMPKSASRYLRRLIEEASPQGGKFINPKCSLGYGHNFYSTGKISLLPGRGRNFRFYGHTPLTQFNHKIMAAIDPNFVSVLTIRSLPDIVVSYAEHIKKSGYGPLDVRMEKSVEGNRFYDSLSEEECYQYLIDFVMPWFSRYLASWLSWGEHNRLLIIKYEDISNRIDETVDEVFDFVEANGINFGRKLNTKSDVVENFNKGVSGRGREKLSGGQLEQISRQASFLKGFPDGNALHSYLIDGC